MVTETPTLPRTVFEISCGNSWTFTTPTSLLSVLSLYPHIKQHEDLTTITISLHSYAQEPKKREN